MSVSNPVRYTEIEAARAELAMLENAYLRRFGWDAVDQRGDRVLKWTNRHHGAPITLGHRIALAMTVAEWDPEHRAPSTLAPR